MNRISSAELHRVVSRHYKLNEPDPIQTFGTEILPVAVMADFKNPHPADIDANRGAYESAAATVGGADAACTWELFNPVNSGIVAEICRAYGGSTYAATVELHGCNNKNPYAGGAGLGHLVHLGTPVQSFGAGNTGLIDGFDTNRLAAVNGGTGQIGVGRVPANGMWELVVPGCPMFLVPGTGLRVQVSGLTAGTNFFGAVWIERRIPAFP